MTTLERRPLALSTTELRGPVTACAAGLVLSLADLLVMQQVPYPWANLANSSAVWAIGAFGLGLALRAGPARSALAGVTMMLVAVESYYVFAVIFGLAGADSLWSATTQTWLTFGIVAGVVFGVAGAWAATDGGCRQVFGAAAGGAVLLGEALHTWLNLEHLSGAFQADLRQTAVVLAMLAFALIGAVTRKVRVFVLASAVAVPGALICSLAFSAAGIAY